MKNNDTKDYTEQLEFLNSPPYYASKKLLYSRQIFRYAVPARTVTKKHCIIIEQFRCLTFLHVNVPSYSILVLSQFDYYSVYVFYGK